MTVLLVLAGLVLLIVGFVANSLAYIFVSIACAAVAGIALVVFSRLTRRRAMRLAAEGPASVMPRATVGVSDSGSPYGASRFAAPVPAPPNPSEGALPAGSWADEEESWEEEAETAPVPVASRSGSEETTGGSGDGAWASAAAGSGDDRWADEDDWGDEVVFPIEDYDELRVGEILPLLPELDPDELEEVRDRESSGKGRATVVDRIDELLGRQPAAAAPRPRRAAAGPYGEGSAEPPADGSAPLGFEVKAKASSGLYHTPESRYYARTSPDVWFATEKHARAAGFIRWDDRQEPRGKTATARDSEPARGGRRASSSAKALAAGPSSRTASGSTAKGGAPARRERAAAAPAAKKEPSRAAPSKTAQSRPAQSRTARSTTARSTTAQSTTAPTKARAGAPKSAAAGKAAPAKATGAAKASAKKTAKRTASSGSAGSAAKAPAKSPGGRAAKRR